MDKLAAMRTFVEIVDQGSLTRAAETLDRSLPTIVRTLAGLENVLGAALLRRTTRRMSLTEEGRVYLERCRRILADIEEAEALLGDVKGNLHGNLRVTAPVLFGQMHVAPAVVSFLRRHCAVYVELLLLDRVVDLVDEGIDVGVRIARLSDSSMVALPVGHVRRVVCASSEFLAQAGYPEHPQELAKQPCVRFRGLTAGSSWSFQENGRSFSVPIQGAFMTNQAMAALEACIAGLGFGTFLSYQVKSALEAHQLQCVLETFEPPPIPVSLVYASSHRLSPRVRVFLDEMKVALEPHVHMEAPLDPSIDTV